MQHLYDESLEMFVQDKNFQKLSRNTWPPYLTFTTEADIEEEVVPTVGLPTP